MKYMGSKRSMLRNGLGEALSAAACDAKRVVDLFTGSGAVAWYAAEVLKKPVLACDLQLFATTVAAAVVTRTSKNDVSVWWPSWLARSKFHLENTSVWLDAQALQHSLRNLTPDVAAQQARLLAAGQPGVVTRSYGGFYFSPWQALWIDALRTTLPDEADSRAVALAALIQAASKCAASPGHTAQPFKPNETAGRFLIEAWERDLPRIVLEAASAIGGRYAAFQGEVICGDANNAVALLGEGDLVFIDPPYSGVHYSRFYHVLETIARGDAGDVSGSGRYPPPSERPFSNYSVRSKSEEALRSLLSAISSRGATAIVTFPAGSASNGLSGEVVRSIAAEFFAIKQERISGKFSTLGGNAKSRAARQDTHELILTLVPAGASP